MKEVKMDREMVYHATQYAFGQIHRIYSAQVFNGLPELRAEAFLRSLQRTKRPSQWRAKDAKRARRRLERAARFLAKHRGGRVVQEG